MLRRRLILALAAVLVALGAAVAAGAPRATAPACAGGDAVEVRGQWTTIRTPAELGELVTVAAGGPDASVLLASDGRRVARSQDAGCTWSVVHELQATTGQEGLPRVAALVMPEDGGVPLMVLEGPTRDVGDRILLSADGGRTWNEEAAGLPAAGRFRRVAAGPDGTRYLSVSRVEAVAEQGADDDLGLTGELYASEDGGATWERRWSGPYLRDVEASPVDSHLVFAARADNQVVRSSDGGRVWSELALPRRRGESGTSTPYGWRDVAVAHRAGDAATVVAAAAPDATATVDAVAASVNGGGAWHELNADGLGAPGGLTFGSTPHQLYSASWSASSSFRGPGFLQYDQERDVWRDADPLELVSLRDPSGADAAGTTRKHGRVRALHMVRDVAGTDAAGPDAIARFDPPDPEDVRLTPPGSLPACAERPYRAPVAPKGQSPRFSPERLDLRLEPGTPARVPLAVDIPKAPSPIDVYFVVDSSSSMQPAIDAVACSVERIQRELAEKATDTWFGLADYNDKVDSRYRRRVKISPPGPALHESLRTLLPRAGDGEPLRTALYQSVTGAGLYHRLATPQNPDAEPQVLVPPRQAAHFRDGAVPVIVAITDEPYDEDLEDEPPRGLVAGELRRSGVTLIGVQVVYRLGAGEGVGGGPADQVRRLQEQQRLNEQLTYLTRESNSLAPPGGVDCDGSGGPDVAEGQPLVCQIGADGIRGRLDDAILSIVRGLDDVRTARIVARPSELQVSVEGASAELDLKKPGSLAGTASVACVAAQRGKRFDLRFDAVVGRRVIATLTGTAVCGDLPAVAPPRLRPRRPDSPAAARPDPPAKAPAPVPPAQAPPTPQGAPALAPPPPPPNPAPVGSGAPAASTAGAQAAQSSAAPASSPTAQAALAGAQQARPAPRVSVVRGDGGIEHHMVASRPARGGSAFGRAHERLYAPPATPTSRELAHGRSPMRHHAVLAMRPRAVATARGKGQETMGHAALVTLGVGACGALGFVAVASHRTRRRIRMVSTRSTL